MVLILYFDIFLYGLVIYGIPELVDCLLCSVAFYNSNLSDLLN